jgi:multidrug resistance efflux pump
MSIPRTTSGEPEREIPMPDEPKRRIPGLGIIIGLAVLALSIAGAAWLLNRPRSGDGANNRDLADLDVVSLGRVDGLTPVASLEPAIPGKVAEIFVSDGQPVKTGDKLLRLDDESLKLKEEEAKKAVEAAEIEVKYADWERSLYPIRKATQKSALAAATERLNSERRLFDEKRMGQKLGTITTAELAAAELLIKQLEQLEQVEQSRMKEVDESEQAVKLKVDAASNKKAVALIAEKQARKAVNDCVLIAPANGVVLRVQTSRGESVVPGAMQAPVIFRPESRLVVRAELEQEFLGRVQSGMKATIRDDARANSPTWNGTVLRVGNWVARKRTVLLEPGEINDVRTVECVIALDGDTTGLLVGQRMRVRIGKAE